MGHGMRHSFTYLFFEKRVCFLPRSIERLTAKRELRSRIRYSRPGCSKQGYDNPGLVPNRIRYESLKTKFSLNSFCLQFDNSVL